jgi:hypothetical protein
VKKAFIFFLALLCIAIAAVLSVPNAHATRVTFLIQPGQQAIEEWNATPGWLYTGVFGNFSASGPIDFYITDQSGAKLLSYTDTNDTNFSFAPQQNGSYQMHFANAYSNENASVVLSYGVGYLTVAHVTEQFGSQVTNTITTSTIVVQLPHPDLPDNDNSYLKYFSFQAASEILRSLNEELQIILPIKMLPATVTCSILVTCAFGTAIIIYLRMVGWDLHIAKIKKVVSTRTGDE